MKHSALPSIDVGPRGFTLHLPFSDRRIEVPATETGIKLLHKIILEAKRELSADDQPTGYIRNFPTQHVVDAWLKEDRARKDEEALARQLAEREKLENEIGVPVAALKIKL